MARQGHMVQAIQLLRQPQQQAVQVMRDRVARQARQATRQELAAHLLRPSFLGAAGAVQMLALGQVVLAATTVAAVAVAGVTMASVALLHKA